MTRQHEVPTHLNVEDKVVFGLTVRQFLYMLVGTSTSYTLWQQAVMLNEPLRIAVVALSILNTLAFALVRPAGRPLEEWLVAALVYVVTPTQATWRVREPDPLDWRPTRASWEELVPDLSWAEDESG